MLELVDGLRIVSVLVVDDRPHQMKSVIDSLRARGCAVTHCTSQEAASNFLSSGVAFDLVVLDWHLEADNSMLAGFVLKDILEYCFVPVAVYTNFYEKAKKELEEDKYEFPRDMIFAWEKKAGAEGLREDLVGWLNTNPQARLGMLWSRSVRLSLAAPLRQLHELHGGQLGSLAQYVWSKGLGRQRLAAMALVGLLQSLLQREVTDRPQLIERILSILEPEVESAGEMPREIFADFRSVEMYSAREQATTVRTGDIIDTGGELSQFVVVLTPACDLAHAAAESDYVSLAGALKRQEVYEALGMNKNTRKAVVTYKKFRYHLLPFVPVGGVEIDLIVDFQDVQACLLGAAGEKINQGLWKIVATVESPYREHLVQRYLSCMGRVGIPDLPANVEEYLLGD